jgi:hypothetical protein
MPGERHRSPGVAQCRSTRHSHLPAPHGPLAAAVPVLNCALFVLSINFKYAIRGQRNAHTRTADTYVPRESQCRLPPRPCIASPQTRIPVPWLADLVSPITWSAPRPRRRRRQPAQRGPPHTRRPGCPPSASAPQCAATSDDASGGKGSGVRDDHGVRWVSRPRLQVRAPAAASGKGLHAPAIACTPCPSQHYSPRG